MMVNESIGINQRAGEYLSTTANGKTILVHRKVWQEHHGEIPEGKVIHHVNGNKKDNRIENLQCLTRSEHTLIHRKENRKRILYPSGNVKVVNLGFSGAEKA